MRDHLHRASARRDDRLSAIRKLTLWIGGGAAAASLGLGTAFAHALPGHAASSPTTSPAKTPSAGSGKAATTSPSAAPSIGTGKQRHHRQHPALARPQQTPAPAPTQAPPVVSSGGS